jgi:hypothetical protein
MSETNIVTFLQVLVHPDGQIRVGDPRSPIGWAEIRLWKVLSSTLLRWSCQCLPPSRTSSVE